MKIKIKKIETYSITKSTREFIFDVDEFRSCTPAFIGKTHREFMDYITNDIEDIKEFLLKNDDIISTTTKRHLYLLDVDPIYEVVEDSRNDYEDSWFVMNTKIDEEIEKNKDISKSKNVL